MVAWLTYLAWASLVAGFVSASSVSCELVAGRRDHLRIANIVRRTTAMLSRPTSLCAYHPTGRPSTRQQMAAAERPGENPAVKTKPLWQKAVVAIGMLASTTVLIWQVTDVAATNVLE